MIAFDTETRNLRWWEGSAFLATWAGSDWERAAALTDDGTSDGPSFLKALADHDVLIAHNAKFDAHQLRETLGYDVFENGHTLHCTALMSRVVYGSSRWDHGLEALSKDLLPNGGKAATKADISDIYKALRGRTSMAHDDAYWEVWQENPEALEAYAMADVRDCYDLFEHLMPQLEADERLMRIYEMELQVQKVVYDAERRGVRIDPAAVENLRQHHAGIEHEAAARLEAQLGFLPEGDGSDDALRVRLPELGVKLTEKTESGEKLAVNAKVLAAHQDHPAVAALLEWRRARKFQSTYLGPLEGREIVHTDFKQHEAKTSRMASARPNLQNLPKRQDTEADENMRMRSIFVPRPGYEFFVADYDQIEPRLFAWYLGDPGYRQLVAENRIYELAAAAAWGGHPQGSPNPDDYAKGGRLEFLRPAAKMIYLAILYGGGGRAVRDQNNAMTPPEFHLDVGWVKDPTNKFDTPPAAQALKKRIIATIPGYWDLAGAGTRWSEPGRLVKTAMKHGHIRTLFGRKQFLQHSEDGEPKYYVLLNQLIQGSAAEVLKQAAIEVAAFLEPRGGYPLLFVHDELVCEVPEGDGEAYGPHIARIMADVADVDPTLTVDWSVTKESYAHA